MIQRASAASGFSRTPARFKITYPDTPFAATHRRRRHPPNRIWRSGVVDDGQAVPRVIGRQRAVKPKIGIRGCASLADGGCFGHPKEMCGNDGLGVDQVLGHRAPPAGHAGAARAGCAAQPPMCPG